MTEPYIDPNSGAAAQPGGGSIVAPAPRPVDLVVKETKADGDELAVVDAQKVAEQSAEELEAQAKASAEAKAAEDVKAAEDAASAGDADAPAESTEGAVESTEDPAEGQAAPAFDPSGATVPQVLAFIEANPDEKDAIIEAERAGKNRVTITEA